MYSVNGQGHVYSDVNFNYKHYAYNPLMGEWQIFDEIIPPYVNSSNSYIRIDNSIYVLQYNSSETELFEFNPLAVTWDRLPYRSGKRFLPIFFNVGNMIYLGSGRFSEPNVNYYLNDYWKVDLSKTNP
jgi:hypothetical protein